MSSPSSSGSNLIPPAVAVRALRSTAPVVVKYFILVEKRMSRIQKKVTTKSRKREREEKNDCIAPRLQNVKESKARMVNAGSRAYLRSNSRGPIFLSVKAAGEGARGCSRDWVSGRFETQERIWCRPMAN